ncbi:MAG: saccharopine dehydrogenase C-terminal domain-containing protein [Bacteroidota bacterium]
MKKIIVLGAGMVGRAMAIDLSSNYIVTSVDLNKDNLDMLKRKKIKTICADLSSAEVIANLVKDNDFVVGAVPGFMGFETLRNVIKSGKDVVDISFFPEDAFELDRLAKKHKVTAVVDCGVAPGMSNLILGYHNKRMKVENFEFIVGGLPLIRVYPFQYKAPFSPVDVIEEYTRPARFMENGKIVVKPALSEPENYNFTEVGTLVGFNTDGLRTLLKTMKIPNMKEKTLRYPGYLELIKLIKDCGFFDTNEIEINGTKIRPIDFSSKILFPQWKLGEFEEEFTAMRILIEGTEKGKEKTYVYSLFDIYDSETETSSMARTTGYSATAVVNLILTDKFRRNGVNPPEYIGESEVCFNFIMNYLKKRKIYFEKNEII